MDNPASVPSEFAPRSCNSQSADLQLPDGFWLSILESPCTFPPDVFLRVMLNLVKNPNVTSSHLFRADIFFDSDVQTPSQHQLSFPGALGAFARHLKAEYRPTAAEISGYTLNRTIVRQLVPRNPQVDRPMVQTCHFFQKKDEEEEFNVVLYIPHVPGPESMPFYHPAVSRLAFLHGWRSRGPNANQGRISVSYDLFKGSEITVKLERTALKLLQTIHKHGQGQLAGYQKRVHLDQVTTQKRYQDTYAKLKAKYGSKLAKEWVEVTDPGKHVFEDIAIAAWLIELWRDLYAFEVTAEDDPSTTGGERERKPPFRGFVDIGCGNGILVSILLSEGYRGWGFDARQRKTWSILDEAVRENLHQRLLVPQIFQNAARDCTPLDVWHNGEFERGVFIISNHADELTAWTPLLAYLNDSAFVAIPCCSHDLAGSRFRAPLSTRANKSIRPMGAESLPITQRLDNDAGPEETRLRQRQAAETGSLARTMARKKMASAYSSLCSYVLSLTEEVGFHPETDILRIPSTRNSCILGRRRAGRDEAVTMERKRQLVTEIVERELEKTIASAADGWITRVEQLLLKAGRGH